MKCTVTSTGRVLGSCQDNRSRGQWCWVRCSWWSSSLPSRYWFELLFSKRPCQQSSCVTINLTQEAFRRLMTTCLQHSAVVLTISQRWVFSFPGESGNPSAFKLHPLWLSSVPLNHYVDVQIFNMKTCLCLQDENTQELRTLLHNLESHVRYFLSATVVHCAWE